MASLEEIKSEIKNIAESVPGIGKVYDRMVYAKDQHQLKELFVKDRVINTLMFKNRSRTAEGNESKSKEIYVKRQWFMKLIYSYSYETGSENTFDRLCEDICRTFNDKYTLNGKVMKHTYLNVTMKYDAEYHGVISHYAEMEMTTYS
jgi:hypothetical protein